MPEIHPALNDLLSITIIVIGVCGLVLQAIRFLLAAIMQPTNE